MLTKLKKWLKRQGDYLKYDEEFRKRRARYGTPWETPDLELLVECNQAGLQDQVIKILNSLNKTANSFLAPQPQTTSNTQNITKPDTSKFRQHPSGACYTFHNQGRCGRANCRFSHICYNPGCGQEHAVYSCPKNPPTAQQSTPYNGGGANKNSSDRPRTTNFTNPNTPK